MADSGIKKVTVYKSELGKVGNSNEYIIKYRIISEDKNRTSHWSPTYVISATPLDLVPGAIQESQNVITVVWSDSLNRPAYDIFVGFDGATPTWHGTSQVHSYSFLKTGTTSVQVQIQVEGINKTLSDDLKIYTGSQSLV